MTTTRTTPISVHGLTKQFGRLQAVEALTFDVRPGHITGFLGPNGAGKTTTLRMLLGLVRPTAGAALIGGRPYPSLPHPRRTVGAVLEATGAPTRVAGGGSAPCSSVKRWPVRWQRAAVPHQGACESGDGAAQSAQPSLDLVVGACSRSVVVRWPGHASRSRRPTGGSAARRWRSWGKRRRPAR